MSMLVSVILPAYNSGKYIYQSVSSVLNQSYSNLELIITDDGSTDDTKEIIQSFDDQRIRLIHHRENQGLIYSLNEAIHLSGGALIARMDADDICHPLRMEKQVNKFNGDPALGICGTGIKTFGATSFNQYYPEQHDEIMAMMLFRCPFAHPTVMMRKNIILENALFYNPDFSHAEDYDLWQRAAFHTRFYNIREALLEYRVHPAQISTEKKDEQTGKALQIAIRQLETVGIKPGSEELKLHNNLMNSTPSATTEQLSALDRWLCRLLSETASKNLPYKAALKKLISELFLQQTARSGLGVKGILTAIRSCSLSFTFEQVMPLLKMTLKSFTRKA
jgi:glycosyltransferase involved in cell wall biosynthesis